MKTIALSLLLTLGLAVNAQNQMVIDSVRILPANPTANDSVWFHVYWHCSWGCALQSPISVTHAANNHMVNACYTVGMITIVTQGDDSVFLFQGPAGFHVVSWQIFQNGSPNGNCDLLKDANQQTVNVLTTGIVQNEVPQLLISHGNGTLTVTESGSLSIYSVTGQLLNTMFVKPGEMISLELNSEILIVDFVSDSGRNAAIKLSGSGR